MAFGAALAVHSSRAVLITPVPLIEPVPTLMATSPPVELIWPVRVKLPAASVRSRRPPFAVRLAAPIAMEFEKPAVRFWPLPVIAPVRLLTLAVVIVEVFCARTSRLPAVRSCVAEIAPLVAFRAILPVPTLIVLERVCEPLVVVVTLPATTAPLTVRFALLVRLTVPVELAVRVFVNVASLLEVALTVPPERAPDDVSVPLDTTRVTVPVPAVTAPEMFRLPSVSVTLRGALVVEAPVRFKLLDRVTLSALPAPVIAALSVWKEALAEFKIPASLPAV